MPKNGKKNGKNGKNRGGARLFRVLPVLGIEHEIKQTIWGVVFAAIGAVLFLAIFGLAGQAGAVLQQSFSWLLGWGYFLLPAAFFALGAIFVFSQRRNVYVPAILGTVLLVGSLLGITKVLGKESGILGSAFGSISQFFGLWASLVILVATTIIGWILMFNISFRKKKQELLKPDAKSLELMVPKAEVASLPVPQTQETIQSSAGADAKKKKEELEITHPRFQNAAWQFPPLSLLAADSTKPTAGDIRLNANIIQRSLANFGIQVEMSEVNVGPTVTQYTLKPAQGVKLAKIVALQNDLSLALAAHPLRVEAPIPGKSLVGIEVPNRSVAKVRLRTLLESPGYREGASLLTFPLGRDVMGTPIFADLTRLPHLLVAGATGSGKSIFIHTLLLSMFYKNPPSFLRLILIDPKRVELSQYQGIPYLLTPVITEGRRAVQALKWAIGEMERRYGMLLGEASRDIFSYNNKIAQSNPENVLPFIIIVIDELADLMAAYGRAIEGSIVRLAQMARATGIHLVVSTQRPSVEVITGLIKANITARVAFQVASQVDSRTILDGAGAEKLLGSGDMLYLTSESPKPKRIQASFISEEEVKCVREHILKVAEGYEEPEGHIASIDEMLEEPSGSDLAGNDDTGYDDLYSEAYRVVVEARKASASLLQRRLKVGYARAARLLDILESRGVIGPGDGAKPREVFIHQGQEDPEVI